MSEPQYRTTPYDIQTMPPGIPYIIGNEAAERFSYYGMKAILFVFLTEHILNAEGNLDVMDKNTAMVWQHNYNVAAYSFPIFGAIISDWIFGKYRTIISLSLMYCLGHVAMALIDYPLLTGVPPRTMLWIALALISIGTGGIKPCVSAHVGDQFGPSNQYLLPRVFKWFYFSINLGSAISTILVPELLRRVGAGLAFGVPGIVMGIATIVFWMGRNKFVHIPPQGNAFFRETFSSDGRRAMLNLVPLYLFIAMFWCLFDQTQTAWVEQAKSMNRMILGYDFDPAQSQATNPILVMVMIPLMSVFVYPILKRFITLSPLRTIGIGLFLTVPAFAVPGIIQQWIDEGQTPHIYWQLLAYVLMTGAEVMVSITALEFSYTQAPKKMKSLIMGLYLLVAVALGNKITAVVNDLIVAKKEQGVTILEGANYYWFFTGAMLVTAVLYVLWSQFYRGQTYIQGDPDSHAA